MKSARLSPFLAIFAGVIMILIAMNEKWADDGPSAGPPKGESEPTNRNATTPATQTSQGEAANRLRNVSPSESSAASESPASNAAVTLALNAPGPAASTRPPEPFATILSGDSVMIDREALLPLFEASVGTRVVIPLEPPVTGVVNMRRRHDSGDIALGIELTHFHGATAFLALSDGGNLGGHLFSKMSRIAYRFDSGVNSGPVKLSRIDVPDLLCAKFEGNEVLPGLDPAPGEEIAAAEEPSGGGIPILESHPGAIKVVYLDFDGETVTGTPWNTSYNAGNPLVAAPFATPAHIQGIWESIAEDYIVFDVNITTSRAAYDQAAPENRVMTIFSPTKSWYGAAGGVAYVNSFGDSPNTVVWVFNLTLNGAAESACHEIGHSLGLRHDGTTTRSYYTGHTHSSGVSWAPVMGTGYSRSIVQFSKGQYLNANRQEDDFLLIQDYLSYRADDHGEAATTSTLIPPNEEGTVTGQGIIGNENDVDVFQLETGENGPISAEAKPFGNYRNLDIKLELLDTHFAVIASAVPEGPFDAAILSSDRPAGTYYLRVSGTGLGDLATGYGKYGSVGRYTLSGTYPSLFVPAAPTGVSASGDSPHQIRVTWEETPYATRYRVLRNTNNDATSAVEVAVTSGLFHDDRSTTPGETFYYFVEASNTAGTSAPGGDSGNAGVKLPLPAGTPANLTVSYGTFKTHAGLSWTGAPEALGYSIYRNTVNSAINADLIAVLGNTTTYLDTEGVPGTLYHYFVRSNFTGSQSIPSNIEIGFRAGPDPLDDSYEINDTRSTAFPLSGANVPRLETLSARALSGDPDWYAVTLDAGDVKLDVTVSWEALYPGIRLSLFNTQGSLLASGGEGVNSAVLSYTGNAEQPYFLLIEGDASPFTPYDLNWRSLSESEAEHALSIDAAIGLSSASGLGEGIINTSGAGQSLGLYTKRNATLTAYVTAENTSTLSGDFVTTGSGAGRFFRLTYLRREGENWENVTTSILLGGASTNLIPFDKSVFRIDATPSVPKRKRRSTTLRITSFPNGDAVVADVVQFTARKGRFGKKSNRR